MSLLEIKGLTVNYGGVFANDEIDIAVEAGQVCGLIGPNGAGKTTFIDAVTGFTAASSGQILFDGQDMQSLTAPERALAGLVRTFQSVELFDDLTVWDNLLVAAEQPRWWSLAADIVKPRRRSAAWAKAEWPLDLLGLQPFRDRLTGDLSHGQRNLVGVARALASSPKLVMLDEPGAGLDTAESEILGRHVRDFVEHGMSVFLIDHDMSLVLGACDYIYVLDFGRVIAHGTPTEIRSNEAVIAAYLGHAPDQGAGERGHVS